jgi:tetratricopeptide (TPR) repeat protein
MVAVSLMAVQSRITFVTAACLTAVMPLAFFADSSITQHQRAQVAACKRNLSKRIEVINNRAVDRAEGGDYKGSIEDCNRAIALDPTYPFAYRNRGCAERKLGDLRAALSDIERAIALDPENPFFLCERAQILADAGRYGLAMKDIEVAMHSYPKNHVRYISALIRCQYGDKRGALLDLESMTEPCRGAQELFASLQAEVGSTDGILLLRCY